MGVFPQGLGTLDCLDRSSRGGLFQKVCLQKETKEGRNGPLYWPGLILWLN
jgi:hypothetical protein